MPTLVVLAAGFGSRFGGGSAKQTAGLGPAGETLLDYAVYDAKAAGFDRLVCVIRRDMQADFEAAVGRRLAAQLPLAYAYQALDDLPAGRAVPPGRQKPWGTGHAVWACRELVDGAFAVVNADDFYGRDSYRLLADHLRDPAAAGHWSLVAFRLDRSLSKHGPVSRGVCELGPGGSLTGIVERTGIARSWWRIVAGDGLAPRRLPAGAPVSLNMWGFGPAVFDRLERSLVAFLDHGEPMGGELYLPAAVSDALAAGEVQVDVLRSPAEWLGVTYRQDAGRVRAALARATRDGRYPSPLWPVEDGTKVSSA